MAAGNKAEADMVLASQLRSGMAIRFEGQQYKVVAAEYHPGQGKMGGSTHTRLRNLDTGTFWEHSFRSELKLEELPLQKQNMEFLYADDRHCCFMDPETFEQTEIPLAVIGQQANFLEPGMRLPVEMLDGRAVAVVFPDVLEVKIADTAPALHQQQTSAFKTAKLENGVEVMVPLFVKTGDVIRLDLQAMRYMDRAKAKH
jgi:elongation factor P